MFELPAPSSDYLPSPQLLDLLGTFSRNVGIDIVPPSQQQGQQPEEVSLTELQSRYAVRYNYFHAVVSGTDPNVAQDLQQQVETLNRIDSYILERDAPSSSKEIRQGLVPIQATLVSMEQGRIEPRIADSSSLPDLTNIAIVAQSIEMTVQSKKFADVFASLLTDKPQAVMLCQTRFGINVYVTQEGVASLQERALADTLLPQAPGEMTVNRMAALLNVDNSTVQRVLDSSSYADREILRRLRGQDIRSYPNEAFSYVSERIPPRATEEYVSPAALRKRVRDILGTEPRTLFNGIVDQYLAGTVDQEAVEALQQQIGKELIVQARGKFQSQPTAKIHESLARVIINRVVQEFEALPPVVPEDGTWTPLKEIASIDQELDYKQRNRRQAIESILGQLGALNPVDSLVQRFRPRDSTSQSYTYYSQSVVDDVLHILGTQTLADENLKDFAGKGPNAATEYFLIRYPTAYQQEIKHRLARLLQGGRITFILGEDGKLIDVEYAAGHIMPPIDTEISKPVTFLQAEQRGELLAQTVIIADNPPLEIATPNQESKFETNISQDEWQQLYSFLFVLNQYTFLQFHPESSGQSNIQPTPTLALLHEVVQKMQVARDKLEPVVELPNLATETPIAYLPISEEEISDFDP